MNKPAAVASAINGFFIKKVKDIISGIPRVDTDPLAKLRERMASHRCSLSLRLVTDDEVMKVIKKIKPTTATEVDYIDNRTIKLVADIITPPSPILSTCPSPPPPSPPSTSGPR